MRANPFAILCGVLCAATGVLLYGPIRGLAFLPGAAAIAADALTMLGLLNFLVLQWFGVRLARSRIGPVHIASTGTLPSGLSDAEKYWIEDGWCVLRWIWPLTGWWTEYRWIARRP